MKQHTVTAVSCHYSWSVTSQIVFHSVRRRKLPIPCFPRNHNASWPYQGIILLGLWPVPPPSPAQFPVHILFFEVVLRRGLIRRNGCNVSVHFMPGVSLWKQVNSNVYHSWVNVARFRQLGKFLQRTGKKIALEPRSSLPPFFPLFLPPLFHLLPSLCPSCPPFPIHFFLSFEGVQACRKSYNKTDTRNALSQWTEVGSSYLNKHIIILNNQRVRVNVAWERLISVGFCAVLHPTS